MSENSNNFLQIIVKWLAILAENYRQEVKATLAEIWSEALKDLTVPQFEAACAKHMQTGRYFPTVADIRIAAGNSPKDKELDEGAESEAAWIRVLRYVNRWHPDCDPPRGLVISRSESRSLQVAGGINMLWELQDEGGTELAFMRKAFLESYRRRDAVDKAMDKFEKRQISGMRSIKEIIGGMPKLPEEPKQ